MTETEKRYYGLLKADNTAPGDVERQQLFYTLARNNELWSQSAKIYSTKDHCLLNGWNNIFTGSLGKMLQRAAHLYNSSNEDIATVSLFWGLDEHNKQTMINAQLIYCGLYDFLENNLE